MYVLIQQDDSQLKYAAIAEVISGVTLEVMAEVLDRIAKSHGVIDQGFNEDEAQRISELARERGLPVDVMPESALVAVPEIVILKSLTMQPNALHYIAQSERGIINWEEFLFLDLVSIIDVRKVSYDDIEFSDGEEPMRHVKRKGIKTESIPHLDLISHDPYVLLRIPYEKFQFTQTGLQLHPTRKQNMTALSIALASRCPDAEVGLGLKWVRENCSPQKFEMRSEEAYEGYLSWCLTRLYGND